MFTIRAVLALSVLAGYGVARVAVPVVLGGLAVLTLVRGDATTAAVLALAGLVGIGLSARAARALRRCAEREPVGVVVPRRGDSPLWSEVSDLSEQLGVRPPDEIRLTGDATVEVWERRRRYGLGPGPRYLEIGLPVLIGLPATQIRALLAHELAHDLTDQGRLPAVCHQARATVAAMVERRPRAAGVVFAGVARLFLALGYEISRDQELRADRAAVRVTDRASVVSAVRELPVLGAVWRRYLTEVIEPAVRSGYAPLSLSDGFDRCRKRWQGYVDALRTAPPELPRPWWDTHPPRGERFLSIELAPESGAAVPERSYRSTPGIREAEQYVIGADVPRVPWEEFIAIAKSRELRGDVERLYQAAGDVAATGVLRKPDREPGLETVLALIEARALPALIAKLDPPTPATARRLLALAFAQAAVEGGVARWRCSGDGRLRVVRPDGGPIPVDELAARVMADSAMVPMVREVLWAVRARNSASNRGACSRSRSL
mgnify:CR=1 FL=1